ncbi:MAG: hypothetical protein MKZ94_17000, partial [Pirellulales bacterium]|nr:hypothetical protein [Pirellulales bacterium]
MEVIDSEVAKFLHEAEKRADELLVEYRDDLENLTQKFVESEELSEEQIADVIGPSVHPIPKVKDEKQDQIETTDPATDETADGDEDTSAVESELDSTETDANEVITNKQITGGESDETDTAPQSF